MLKKLLLMSFSLVTLGSVIMADNESIAVDRDQYRRYVEAVTLQESNNSIHAFVTLSDGSKWKLHLDNEQQEVLESFEKIMQPETEVVLDINRNTPYYRISSGEDNSYVVEITNDTKKSDAFPVVIKLETSLNKKTLCIFPSYTQDLYLSDNSHWKSNTVYPFKVGDPVIVSRRSVDNFDKWNLINLNGSIELAIKFYFDHRIATNYHPVNVVTLNDPSAEGSEDSKIDESEEEATDDDSSEEEEAAVYPLEYVEDIYVEDGDVEELLEEEQALDY